MRLNKLINQLTTKLPLNLCSPIPPLLMVDSVTLSSVPEHPQKTTLYLEPLSFTIDNYCIQFSTPINVLPVLIELGIILISNNYIQKQQNPLALKAIAADFDIIIQIAANELDAPLILLDLDGQQIITATTPAYDESSTIGHFLANQDPALDPSKFYHHMYLTTQAESAIPLLLTPLAYQGNPLGYLAIVVINPLTSKQTRLLPAFARVITCASVRDKIVGNSLSQRDRLVSLLLTEPTDTTIEQQFKNQGAILPENMVLIKCEPIANQSLPTLKARLTYLMMPMFSQVLITIHHRVCLALVTINLSDYNQQLFHDQLTTIATRGKCRLIVSNFYTNPHDTISAYQFCNRAARLKNHTDPVLFCSDVFFNLILTQVNNRDSILPFLVDPCLKVLINYDQTNHTELVYTLQAYLLATCNLTETARTLFVHPNTLRKRMQHITYLTGLDLKDAKTCFKLAASLEISHYLQI